MPCKIDPFWRTRKGFRIDSRQWFQVPTVLQVFIFHRERGSSQTFRPISTIHTYGQKTKRSNHLVRASHVAGPGPSLLFTLYFLTSSPGFGRLTPAKKINAAWQLQDPAGFCSRAVSSLEYSDWLHSWCFWQSDHFPQKSVKRNLFFSGLSSSTCWSGVGRRRQPVPESLWLSTAMIRASGPPVLWVAASGLKIGKESGPDIPLWPETQFHMSDQFRRTPWFMKVDQFFLRSRKGNSSTVQFKPKRYQIYQLKLYRWAGSAWHQFESKACKWWKKNGKKHRKTSN